MSHPTKLEMADHERGAARAWVTARATGKKADRERAEEAELLREQAFHERRAAVLELARRIHHDLRVYGSMRLLLTEPLVFASIYTDVANVQCRYVDLHQDGSSPLAYALEMAERFTP